MNFVRNLSTLYKKTNKNCATSAQRSGSVSDGFLLGFSVAYASGSLQNFCDTHTGEQAVCFSAAASFAVGGALVPMGGYCLWTAYEKNPRTLGLAAVPLFFGVQQISEGFVWLAPSDGVVVHAQAAPLIFLFFALAFWPFWFPMFATLMETNPTRRRFLAVFSLLMTGWFWVLYFPLAADPDNLLQTNINHHSIRYSYDKLAVYQFISPYWLRLLYVLTLAAPMLVSSQRWGRLPGLLLVLSAIAAAILFDYAFVSVWCFFAAILASYICLVFYRLPRPLAMPIPGERGALAP
jgi:hypothetical protein